MGCIERRVVVSCRGAWRASLHLSFFGYFRIFFFNSRVLA